MTWKVCWCINLKLKVDDVKWNSVVISFSSCDNLKISFQMKTPERWRTSRDPCCNVPSPQSPIAMMDRHTQTDRHTHAHTHTHTHTHTPDRFYYLDRVADAGGKNLFSNNTWPFPWRFWMVNIMPNKQIFFPSGLIWKDIFVNFHKMKKITICRKTDWCHFSWY